MDAGSIADLVSSICLHAEASQDSMGKQAAYAAFTSTRLAACLVGVIKL